MTDVRNALYTLLASEHPMTVRQVFYRLVSQGAIGKTEAEYKGTVVRLLGEMRRDGTIAYDWISDNTRWMRKPHSFDSMEDALITTARTYRRNLWNDQDAYVEVWLEKDALAGVVMEETATFDVPLMVTRGYSSLSFLSQAAESIEEADEAGKTAYLYYFGDYDPSGLDIPRKTEATLREMAPDAELSFERVAVTPEQIEAFQLPTRPTKKTDTRSAGFIGESVEVDAIPPADLRAIVRGRIERHIDLRPIRANAAHRAGGTGQAWGHCPHNGGTLNGLAFGPWFSLRSGRGLATSLTFVVDLAHGVQALPAQTMAVASALDASRAGKSVGGKRSRHKPARNPRAASPAFDGGKAGRCLGSWAG